MISNLAHLREVSGGNFLAGNFGRYFGKTDFYKDEENDMMKQYFSEAKQYFAFQWHITDECDQRCKHCYIFSEDNCKKPDAMDWLGNIRGSRYKK